MVNTVLLKGYDKNMVLFKKELKICLKFHRKKTQK